MHGVVWLIGNFVSPSFCQQFVTLSVVGQSTWNAIANRARRSDHLFSGRSNYRIPKLDRITSPDSTRNDEAFGSCMYISPASLPVQRDQSPSPDFVLLGHGQTLRVHISGPQHWQEYDRGHQSLLQVSVSSTLSEFNSPWPYLCV